MIDNTMIEKNMYRLVNSILLMACCLWCLGEYIGVSKVSWSHFLAGWLVVVVLTIWCQCGLKGRAVLVMSVVVAFVVTNLVIGGEEAVKHIQYYVQGVLGINSETASWGRPQECIQTALITLVCFGLSLLAEQLFLVKAVMAALLLCVLGADLLTDRNLAHMGVVCVILYVVIVLVEWTERNWKKERIAGTGHYMVRILPFLIVYFILTALMPAPEKPYDWQFVKDAYINAREAFLEISRNWINSNREDFAFGTSGFDGDGTLLPGISDENKTLMIIQGQASLKTNVYLTGKIYDTFDGNGWVNTDESEVDDRQLDALETLYAVQSYDASAGANYLEKTGLKIWYEDFRTGYLFAPLKTLRLLNLEIIDYVPQGGNYLFDEKQGYGLEYQTTYLQLNVDHPVFYEFLEEEIPENEELFNELQLEHIKKSKYKLTDLDNRKDEIFETYCKPVVLSTEAEEWLLEVTEGGKTDIDKLKALEAALQQMIYTKTPGEMPKWVDSESEFLDYFLLESRQGYCVYYASAFVLLARAEGLPARYVEGFCVPVSGTYMVPVTSDMAHAWPEVYIENVGWIPFEPTPGYSELRYTPWEIQGAEDGIGGSGVGLSGDENTEDETLDEEIIEEELVQEEQETVSDKQHNTDNFLKIIGVTIAFAVAAGIVILSVDFILRRSRIKKYTLEQRFRAAVAVNMRMLAALGYERRENETLSELRVRAWAIMDDEESDDKPEFMFLKLYEEYLYGQYPVQEEMLDILAAEKGYLLRMLKKWKPVMYLYMQFYYNIF